MGGAIISESGGGIIPFGGRLLQESMTPPDPVAAVFWPNAGRLAGLSASASMTRHGIVMSGRAPADQGLFFGVALVASAVMSSAFFCGE